MISRFCPTFSFHLAWDWKHHTRLVSDETNSWSRSPPESRLGTSVATLKKLKSLDGPLKNPKKTPGQISMQLDYILGKKSNFSRKKSNVFGKKCLFSAKISDDIF